MSLHPVLIAGQWRAAKSTGSFHAVNPATGETLSDEYPVSAWDDCDAALTAAQAAAVELRSRSSADLAAFLENYAERIERRAAELVEAAHQETAYPKTPRLADVELPRTTKQLRELAAAAREGSWALPTIDTKLNIRSLMAPLGPVCVFGPNNFPFAFNSASGGDFASAIAAGNPVIAKAHTSHPTTTRIFAEAAHEAARESRLPSAIVQMIYRTSHEDGARLVADPRIGATAYTGSRTGGLRLKAASDAAGKPIYLELSSVNPVVVLPGALAERGEKIVEEFCASALMGTGQFCTNPGLLFLFAGPATEAFIRGVTEKFAAAPRGCLLSAAVASSLGASVGTLRAAGAELLTGGERDSASDFKFANTLLRVSGRAFIQHAEALQTEAFGNASLLMVVQDAGEATAAMDSLEGNLTGCFYSAASGADDSLYAQLEPHLRPRVGRLLNDRMPTGVAVTPAMNHGGPYPSTGHPGFTAVGVPALRRFAMLQCYDNVRPDRLPPALANKSPHGRMWRQIDGVMTLGDVPA